ncbi:uncharacterized protein METZ01_LOCUS127981 [marine metagenome]|uniref:Uncharacterized protein n=1 Tax=marine metagenome TaxID=408172 RepID=A0A381YFC4_9ZZZZ
MKPVLEVFQQLLIGFVQFRVHPIEHPAGVSHRVVNQ